MRSLVFAMTASGTLAVATLCHAQTAPPAASSKASPPSQAADSTTAPAPVASPDAVRPAASPQTMNKAVSLFGAVGYSYGFATGLGVGARFQWVLVPDGFLKALPKGMHDEFALEPGFDYFHAGYSVGEGAFMESWNYNEFTPLVGAVWNFWLSDKVAVYPKVDIGYRIASWSVSVNGTSQSTGHADLFPVYFEGAAGIDYRIGMVSLRAEAGWQDVRAGAGVTFL